MHITLTCHLQLPNNNRCVREVFVNNNYQLVNDILLMYSNLDIS